MAPMPFPVRILAGSSPLLFDSPRSGVGAMIAAAHERHGYSIHPNRRSMPAIASSHSTDFAGVAHADFVIEVDRKPWGGL